MYNQILLISLKINLPLKLMLIFKVICSLMTYDIVNGLNENTTHRYILVDLFGLPGQGYYMTVFTGTPGQKMNLLIDTGSSNIAISGRNLTNVDSWFKLNQSSTLQCSNSVQKVRYELGFWYGIYCQDDFDFENAQNTINLDATINSYQISLPFGLIFNSTRLFLRHNHSSWYGIIGLAFTSLYVKPNKIFSNRNTKYAVKNSQVKSTNQALLKPIGFLDRLNEIWKVKKQFGLLLCGTTTVTNSKIDSRRMSGKLVIGQTDLSLVLSSSVSTSMITNFSSSTTYFTPIRKAWYYEIILTNLIINNQSLITDCKELNKGKTIIDSGTTNIYLPKRIFHRLVHVLKANVNKNPQLNKLVSKVSFWHGQKAYCLAESSEDNKAIIYGSFPQIEFQLVSSVNTSNEVLSLIFSPQQYIRYLGQITRHNENRDCFAFAIQSTRRYTILGSVFLEAYYTEFDQENMRIGFTNSPCTTYTNITGIPVSKVNGLKQWSNTYQQISKVMNTNRVISSPFDCAVYRPTKGEHLTRFMNILTITFWLSLTMFVFFIPLLVLLKIKCLDK